MRVLAVLFVMGTFLDEVRQVRLSSFRFADNPATIIGLALLIGFIGYRYRALAQVNRRNAWFVAFIVVTALEEIPRYFVLGPLWGRAFASYLQYVQVVVLYVIFFDLARDPRVIRSVGKAFVACAALMSFGVNLSLPWLVVERVGRHGVKAINLNGQAFIYALAIVGIFCWILARWPRFGWPELASVAASGSMLLALAKTGSRGGAAALLLGVGAATVVYLRRRRLSAYILVVPLAFAGIGAGLLTSEILTERTQATLVEGNTGLRVELTRSGMELFRERPFIGWGSTFSRFLGAHMNLGRSIGAHNAYIQTLLAFGLIGFIPWFVGLGRAFLDAWWERSTPWGGMLVALMVTMLSFCAVSNMAYSKYLWILLAFAGNAGVMSLEPLKAARRRRRSVGRLRQLDVEGGPGGGM